MQNLLLAILVATTAVTDDPPNLPAPRYPVGAGGQLALADVDGDGVLDVGSARLTGGWGLQRGRPDGSFGPVEFNPAPTAPYLAEFADVDGDGDLDAITGVHQFIPGLAGVQALLNDGDGHFTPAFSYVTGAIYAGFDPLATGDYDGNGMADIAVVRSTGATTSEILIFLASGGGNFSGPASYAVTSGGGRTFAAGDLDGDDDLDLAVVLINPELRIAEFFNQGDGSFVAGPVTPNYPSNPEWGFQLADLDGDGRLDATFHEETNPILHVLPGQSDGSFGADVVVNLPIDVDGLAFSDIDGDDLPEAVLGGEDGVVTLHNLGGFAFEIDERLAVELIDRPLVADLDIDGRLDILAVSSWHSFSAVLLQRLDGSHASAQRIDGSSNLTDAVLADLDGDDRLDLVETHSSPPAVHVRLQGRDASFQVVQVLPTSSAPEAFVGLLDADDSPDLVVATGTSFAVALGAGDGTFGALSAPVVGGNDLQLVDLTGDGELDLVGWIFMFGNQLRVMTGDGNGGFTGPQDWPSFVAMGEIGAVDLNGDGDIDIVAGPGTPASAELTRWDNNGSGGMIQTVFTPALVAPSSEFIFGDVNGDFDADMLAWPGQRWLGQPGSNFTAGITLPESMDEGVATVSDVDGDGRAEILVAEPVMAFLQMLQFGGSPRAISCGHHVSALLTGDVNGDGRTDIVSASQDGHVTFVEQLPPDPFTDLGHALAGSEGDPVLTGVGTLEPSTPVAFRVTNAKPFSSATLIVGVSLLQLPFKGGVLVPSPTLLLPPLPTGGLGKLVLGTTWPPALPSGVSLYLQAWIPDVAGPVGFAATNGLRAKTP